MVVGRFERRMEIAATYAVLAAFVSFSLFPFLWMFDTAFKPLQEVMTASPGFGVAHPTFGNFTRVLTGTPFLIYLRNSAIVATTSTVLTLTVSTFAAYALSRFPTMTVVRTVGGALLVSQAIPGVLLLVPLYMVMQRLGLLSTYASLILVYCTFTVPLCAFMLRGFFDQIPRELEEAAEMDGSSRLGFIWRILLPLSVPGLLATAIFVFVTAWNEFMFGYVLINDDAHRTLTPGMMLFKGSHLTDWGALMAASVMTIVPVALGFVYLQRYLARGMGAGAVKG